jgi:type VI secretion system protein ImpJ
VIWSEGLFLRPQHFQQQQRHVEHYIEQRAGAVRRNAWGFLELQVDRDLLAIGKFALRRALGVFPDGTPFRLPDDDPLPAPVEVGPQARDSIVYLGIPVRRTGALEVERGTAAGTPTRFVIREYESRDITTESSELVPLEVSALRTQILLQGSALDEFVSVPVARIIECRSDRQVVLDEGFMPTVLDIGACLPLARFSSELLGMVRQRADELARVVGNAQHGGVSDVGQFLQLQAFNRHELLLQHLVRQHPVHPEELYQLLFNITGDLCTISSATRRPPSLPEYVHATLQPTFEPLIQALRGYLDSRPPNAVVSIALERKQASAYLAVIRDTSLFDSAQFVIAAKAQIQSESLRRQFPALVKLAPAPHLARYVEALLPGIGLQPMTSVPNVLPYLAGYEYFRLDSTHASWSDLKTAGALGMFVGQGLPGLEMQMWAIRQ